MYVSDDQTVDMDTKQQSEHVWNCRKKHGTSCKIHPSYCRSALPSSPLFRFKFLGFQFDSQEGTAAWNTLCNSTCDSTGSRSLHQHHGTGLDNDVLRLADRCKQVLENSGLY
ncbi:hypothetical protein Trydic_g17781 [Trypoxylus dichotomus]